MSAWEQECAARAMTDRQLADEIDVILRDLPAFRVTDAARLAEMSARLRDGDRTRITTIRERLYAIREPVLLGKVDAARTRAAVTERAASGVPWYDRKRGEWRTEGWRP